MATTDLDAYHHLFIQSAKDCLNNLKSNLNTYINSLPQLNLPAVSEMFRLAHMIKGQAAAMGYPNTAQYCLALQRIFQVVKEKNLILTPDQLNQLNQGLDTLSQNLSLVEQQKKELSFSDKITNLELIYKQLL